MKMASATAPPPCGLASSPFHLIEAPPPLPSLSSHRFSPSSIPYRRVNTRQRPEVEMMLTIDGEETTEGRIRRLISENPVVIFSRASCCMCHVMRQLLATVGVHPTVIELDDVEMDHARQALEATAAPAVFIGGARVGGLESLMALHLSGRLIPRLREVGAVGIVTV